MPIYEYRCPECEQIFEEWQKNHDDVEVACPVCGAMSGRIISNTSFVLKGGGWYDQGYSKADGGSCSASTNPPQAPKAESSPCKKDKAASSSSTSAASPAKTASAG